MQELRVEQIAAMLKGEVRGDGARVITGVSPLESAGPADLTFLFAVAKSQSSHLTAVAHRSSAGAILVKDFDEAIPTTQIKVAHPYAALVGLLEQVAARPLPAPGIHPTAVVHEQAVIGEQARIGPYVVIGAGCKIGAGCVIHAHAVLYDQVILGERCEIHAGAVLRERVILGNDCLVQPGAVLGGEGFGYLPDPALGHRRIPHVGTVRFGDRVDVGANASVDRATFGETFLDESTKLDSLVQVGHNNRIGKRTLICAMTGVGGSCTIGNDVVLGGHVGVADHINIVDRVRVGGKSGIGINLEEAGDYMGYPAPIPAKQHWRQNRLIARLPELFRKLTGQEQRLAKLEEAMLLKEQAGGRK